MRTPLSMFTQQSMPHAAAPSGPCRPALRWAFAAGVTALALAGCASSTTSAGSGATPTSGGSSASVSGSAVGGASISLAPGATPQDVARELLAMTPQLPGAVKATAGYMPPVSAAGSGVATDRSRAPGTLTQAEQYLADRTPAAFTEGLRVPEPSNVSLTNYLASVPGYSRATISIMVTPDGASSVSVTRTAIVVPAGTGLSSSSALPAGVSAVDVSLNRSTLPAVHRTVTGTAAQSIAAAVNALPRQAIGVAHCGAITDAQDTLAFTADGRTITATVQVGPCGSTTVTDGASTFHLTGGATVNAAIVAALGLPAGYGH